MSKQNGIDKDKLKLKEIRKRNVLSFLIFLLLVLACTILSHILPEKAKHHEPVKAVQSAVTDTADHQ